MSVQDVLDSYRPSLMSHPAVTGTGTNFENGRENIIVYIKDRRIQALIPSSLDGYRVKFIYTGSVAPLPKMDIVTEP